MTVKVVKAPKLMELKKSAAKAMEEAVAKRIKEEAEASDANWNALVQTIRVDLGDELFGMVNVPAREHFGALTNQATVTLVVEGHDPIQCYYHNPNDAWERRHLGSCTHGPESHTSAHGSALWAVDADNIDAPQIKVRDLGLALVYAEIDLDHIPF